MIVLSDSSDRVVWLLVVPFAAATVPWLPLMMLTKLGQDDAKPGFVIALAVSPVIGATASFARGRLKHTTRTLLPLVPYAVLAVCFCAFLLLGTVNLPPRIDDVPKWMDLMDFLAVLVGFLLPFAALIGGSASLNRVRHADALTDLS